jgi:hypothetical protein
VSRNETIQRLYTDAKIRDAARYLAGAEWHDVLSEAITRICELPDERFNAITSINNFAFITMRNIVVDIQRKRLDTVRISEDYTETEHDYQPDVLLDTFKQYCYKTANQHPLESVRLMADVVYHYLTYTPTKRRSTRDFSAQTKIDYSTICNYIREIRKRYEDSVDNGR